MSRSNKLCFRAGLDYAPECAISHSRLRRLEAAAGRVRRKRKSSSSPRPSEPKQPRRSLSQTITRTPPSATGPAPDERHPPRRFLSENIRRTTSATGMAADPYNGQSCSDGHVQACESSMSLEGMPSGSFAQEFCSRKCCREVKDGRPDTPDRDPETASAVSTDSGSAASGGSSPLGSSANLQDTGSQVSPEPLPSGRLASLVRLLLQASYVSFQNFRAAVHWERGFSICY